jgi:hypothetical protein
VWWRLLRPASHMGRRRPIGPRASRRWARPGTGTRSRPGRQLDERRFAGSSRCVSWGCPRQTCRPQGWLSGTGSSSSRAMPSSASTSSPSARRRRRCRGARLAALRADLPRRSAARGSAWRMFRRRHTCGEPPTASPVVNRRARRIGVERAAAPQRARPVDGAGAVGPRHGRRRRALADDLIDQAVPVGDRCPVRRTLTGGQRSASSSRRCRRQRAGSAEASRRPRA